MNKTMRMIHRLAVAAFVGAGAVMVSPAAVAQAVAPASATEYRLGAGDVVRISVYQNPDLTLETRIGEAGTVSYPLLGTVRIGSLPVSAAEKVIASLGKAA